MAFPPRSSQRKDGLLEWMRVLDQTPACLWRPGGVGRTKLRCGALRGGRRSHEATPPSDRAEMRSLAIVALSLFSSPCGPGRPRFSASSLEEAPRVARLKGLLGIKHQQFNPQVDPILQYISVILRQKHGQVPRMHIHGRCESCAANDAAPADVLVLKRRGSACIYGKRIVAL